VTPAPRSSERAQAHTPVETAARESYGRLVAFLAARARPLDMAAVEDALADAFVAALEQWPTSGVPDKPEGWLLTVARRRLTDLHRRGTTRTEAAVELALIADEAATHAGRDDPFPDERLKLMFVCAHPALPAAARTPLMLQTVLGLDATTIASAFLVKPAAMGQTLVRAKARIRDTGLVFAVPEPSEWPARVGAVLEAIYAAFGTGWGAANSAGAGALRDAASDLTTEAIHLGRVLAALLPHEPEVFGLMSLMLACEARRGARRTPAGEYVPLSEQDPALWNRRLMTEAETCLATAFSLGVPGPFQYEAAIQSAHMRRAVTGQTDWHAIALFYEALVRLAPTLGARVGRAAAVGEMRGAASGLDALNESVSANEAASYQPYWALRAHLLKKLGTDAVAWAEAHAQAVGLCDDPAVRAWLLKQG
jgi:predicted RNA polymerase sigma factor